MKKGIVFLVVALSMAMLITGCKDKENNQEESWAYEKITAEEAKEKMESEDVVIVDVRRQDEYDAGHIKNAILIPNESINDEDPELLKDKEATILIYCRSGRRSNEAAGKLAALGYKHVYDFGGVIDWPYELVTE